MLPKIANKDEIVTSYATAAADCVQYECEIFPVGARPIGSSVPLLNVYVSQALRRDLNNLERSVLAFAAALGRCRGVGAQSACHAAAGGRLSLPPWTVPSAL